MYLGFIPGIYGTAMRFKKVSIRFSSPNIGDVPSILVLAFMESPHDSKTYLGFIPGIYVTAQRFKKISIRFSSPNIGDVPSILVPCISNTYKPRRGFIRII